MIYLFNLLLIPIYYFVINATIHNKKKARNYFFLVVALHAILFRALANPYVYPDTQRYTYAFDYIAGMKFKEMAFSINQFTGWGVGYLILNWIIGQLTHDATYLFIVLSVISVGGVMLFYYKTSYTPLLTVVLYLSYPMMYTMGFGVVRQHLAVVFVLWALYYADKLKYSIPLILIGILCHTSSMVFLPFYFIRNLNLKKFNSFNLFWFSVIGFVVMTFLVGYVLSFLSRYEEVMQEEGEQTNIVPVFMIGVTVLLFYITGIVKRISEIRDKMILRFLIYGLVIALFGMTVPVAGRLSLCFIYALPVAVSILYNHKSKNNKDFVSIYITVILLAVSFLVYGSSAKFATYLFFWDKYL